MAPLAGVLAALLLVLLVPGAWAVVWALRDPTPAIGAPEDFPLWASWSIAMGGPLALGWALASLAAPGARRLYVALTAGLVSFVLWLGGRIALEVLGPMVCAPDPGVGPHLAARRLVSLLVSRLEPGVSGYDFGAAPTAALVVGGLAYAVAGTWSLRATPRAWAGVWPFAAAVGMVVGGAVLYFGAGGGPERCST